MKGKDVIIALDFKDRAGALAFLDGFGGERPYVKIGMELYYAEGPDMVRRMVDRGHKVFLDLKVHDIPNTAAGAVRSTAMLGASMINLHAGGGVAMMRAASDAMNALPGEKPLLIAVTVLTSLSLKALNDELGIAGRVEDVVLQYAVIAQRAGLDGVVCSPHEAGPVHRLLGEDFVTVTPGVRFAGQAAGDQQRVTTPGQAAALSADYIVVGRPITQSDNPLDAYRRCRHDFVGI